MFEINMRRIFSDSDSTVGFLQYDTNVLFTLEDEYRTKKVANETRIPEGRYEIKLRTDSPMCQRYRQKFGANHEGIPWLQDVPGFTYIYIHVGNTDEDTAGCVLVGEAANAVGNCLLYSTPAYTHLQEWIQSKLKVGRVFITIQDDDVESRHTPNAEDASKGYK